MELCLSQVLKTIYLIKIHYLPAVLWLQTNVSSVKMLKCSLFRMMFSNKNGSGSTLLEETYECFAATHVLTGAVHTGHC